MAGLKWAINDHIDIVPCLEPLFFFNKATTLNGKTLAGTVDIPLNVKWYFGGIDSSSFFVGAGLDYFWVNWIKGENTGHQSFGPQACFGFNKKIKHLGLGARLSFTYGLTKQYFPGLTARNNLFTIGIFVLLPSPGELKKE